MTEINQLCNSIGQSLLLAGVGYQLIQIVRGELDVLRVIETLVIAMIGIRFYPEFFSTLESISQSLTQTITHSKSGQSLNDFIVERFKEAYKPDTLDVLGQAWRFGVWGIVSTLVDMSFLVLSYLLTFTKEVFWEILKTLFPICAGVYPLFDSSLKNFISFAFELSLWIPLLGLIQLISGEIARRHVGDMHTLGVSIIAIELSAVTLMLGVPVFAHRLMSGSLNSDSGVSHQLYSYIKRSSFFLKSKVGAFK
ncbi:MAG: hypothetical protein KA715_00140 [Xanthomonadaceae bacterium]|nr:hypothetical protein [Xanthomonadaceae bacterium]